MPNIRMPDGKVVSFPEHFSRDQIRGLMAHKYPREIGAAGAAQPRGQRDNAGHPEFVAPDQAPPPPAGAGLTGIMSAIESMPVAGPFARQGVEWAASQLGSALTGQPAEDVRGEMSNMVDQGQTEHPLASGIGSVGGAILGTAPMVAAAPGLMGAGAGPLGAGLIGRSLMAGGSGAAIGSADAAVRGNNPLSGAAWGGGLGLAGPAIGQVVGSAVRGIANRLPGRGSGAERAFGRAAGADGVDDIASRMGAIGDDAMPMDLGPNLQRQAGALAATPGRGQEVVRSAVRARDAGANQRITSSVDDILGPAPVPSRIEAGIRANQTALGPHYDEVFQNARAVDTEPLAHNLESMAVNLRGDAQRSVQRVRQMLNITGADQLDPNPYTLFQTRQAIDGMLGTETNGNAVQALTVARQQVNRILEESVPNIRSVDAQFAELARQGNAVGRGQQVLDSGRTAPRPAELADEVADAAIPQGEFVGPSAVPLRLRQGTRAEIDRIIGTNANDRVALQRLIKGEGDWNRSKLVTQFGEDRANRLLTLLEREGRFAHTSNVVTQNSETAARQAAQGEIAPTQREPGMLRSAGNMKFGDAVSNVTDRIGNAFRGARQGNMNEELANLLTGNDPQAITRAIRMVQAAQKRGDLTAARAKQLVQSMQVAGSQEGQKRKPLEITVGRPRQ